ncbi:MAG: DUF47 family protein, partial [Candidatus Hadarchaeales archaeon]
MAEWKAGRTAVMAAEEASMLHEGTWGHLEDYRIDRFRSFSLLHPRFPPFSAQKLTPSRFLPEGLEEVEKIHKTIEMRERKADALRRGIVDELARGDLPTSDKADLMRLARRMDWVADWAHESSRILVILLPIIEEISRSSEQLKEVCLKIAAKLEECTSNLVEAIRSMAEGDLEKLLTQADKVEQNEEDVDALYEDARKEVLYIDGKAISIGGLVIFSQFLDALEDMADNCEHTCDQLR